MDVGAPNLDSGNLQRRLAFTLIELLTSIAVVAIIFALVIPVLRGAKERARETRVLVDIRTSSAAFDAYSDANRGWNPWVPLGASLRVHPQNGSTIVTDDPFVLSYAWPAVFHHVTPWAEHYAAWRGSPVGTTPWSDERDTLVWPTFEYCRSLQGRPGLWETAIPSDPLRLSAGTRLDEVQFPSEKARLYDEHRAHLRRDPLVTDPRAVAMCDGSAAMRLDADATDPVQNHLTTHPRKPYHDTPGGLRGRDH